MAGLPWWLSSKSVCQSRKWELDPWEGRIPWRRKRQPTPVFLPEKSSGQRSLVGYSPWVAKSQTQLSDWTTTATLGDNLAASYEVQHTPTPWPSHLVRGIHRRKIRTSDHIKSHKQMFAAALFIITKNYEESKCSTDVQQWMDKVVLCL